MPGTTQAPNWSAISTGLNNTLSNTVDLGRSRHPLLAALKEANINQAGLRSIVKGTFLYTHLLTVDPMAVINSANVGVTYAQEIPTQFPNYITTLDQKRVEFTEAYYSIPLYFTNSELEVLTKAPGGNFVDARRKTAEARFSDAIYKQLRENGNAARDRILGIPFLWGNTNTVGGESMTQSWWQTRTLAATSSTLNLTAFQLHRNWFKERANPNGGDMKARLCIASRSTSNDCYTALESAFVGKQTFQNVQMANHGFDALQYGETAIISDSQASAGTLEWYDTDFHYWNASPIRATALRDVIGTEGKEIVLGANLCYSISDMGSVGRSTGFQGLAA